MFIFMFRSLNSKFIRFLPFSLEKFLDVCSCSSACPKKYSFSEKWGLSFLLCFTEVMEVPGPPRGLHLVARIDLEHELAHKKNPTLNSWFLLLLFYACFLFVCFLFQNKWWNGVDSHLFGSAQPSRVIAEKEDGVAALSAQGTQTLIPCFLKQCSNYLPLSWIHV